MARILLLHQNAYPMVTENKMMALHIEISRSNKALNPFYFNDTMIHALCSGLSAVYNEVFVWSMDKYIAVWVVGKSPEMLINAFAHHSRFYEKTSLLHEDKALGLFSTIIDQNSWGSYSLRAKLETFENALRLSREMDCNGPMLSSAISASHEKMANAPILQGYSNMWSSYNNRVVSVLNPESVLKYPLQVGIN